MSYVSVSPSLRCNDSAMPCSIEMPASGPVVAVEPFAADEAVGLRQFGGIRKIELPLGQAAGAGVGVLRSVEPRPVDGDQPPANHRIQRGGRAGGCLHRRADAVDLIGQHVEHEVVSVHPPAGSRASYASSLRARR
jgi:hypothetical protein